MRAPPSYLDFPKYPVVAVPILAAVATSIAWWSGYDIERLELGPQIASGQIWRLVTCTLPHVNILHLLFNCYFIWIFGTTLQDQWGSARTFGAFLFLGATSMGAQYVFSGNGVGLSGVGYGFFGLVWALQRYDRRFYDAIDPRTTQTFVIWFVICIVTTYLGWMNVANVAHGAGALFGGLVGIAYAHKQKTFRISAAIGLVLGVLVIAYLLMSIRRFVI